MNIWGEIQYKGLEVGNKVGMLQGEIKEATMGTEQGRD
jgi:hypothetical protein